MKAKGHSDKQPVNKVMGYVRVSTDSQDVTNQRAAILEYANNHGFKNVEFIEVEMSSRRSQKDRRIEELKERLKEGDTLLTSELSRLGRSTVEVLTLINALIESHIRVIILKQSLDLKGNHDMTSKVMITLFSLFAELERDLISMRTKEALSTKKKAGMILGKPKGTIQLSKFDKDLSRIKELLALGLSIRKISKHLGLTNHIGLNNYLKKRGIKASV